MFSLFQSLKYVFNNYNQLTINNNDFLVFSDCISTREHSYKLLKIYSHVNTHKYFSPNRIFEVWNAVPVTVVETSSLNVLNDYLTVLI